MAARLTELEWWALCSAVALREEYLDDLAERGLPVGKDRAALRRAADKVRLLAPPKGGRRVLRRRAAPKG